MQPDQQYNFITDPTAMNRGNSNLQGQSPQKRLILGVAFIVAVLLVAGIALSLILNAGKADNSDLITLRAHQTEIIRVTELGLKGSTDANARNTVATLQSSVTSDEGTLDAYLSSISLKVKPEELATKKDSTIDEALESAKQRGTFDAELLSTLKDLSVAYDKDLGKALESATTDKEKQLITVARDSLNVIFAE